MQKYSIKDGKIGPFHLEFRNTFLHAVKRWKTQSWEHEGCKYWISVLEDPEMELHCYDLGDIDHGVAIPFEVGIIKDGGFFEPTDIDYRFCGSDMDVMTFLWDTVQRLDEYLKNPYDEDEDYDED